MLRKFCSIQNCEIVNILHLDLEMNQKQKNTAVVLITTYIGCIWYNRTNTIKMEARTYKTSILKHHHMLSLILKEKMSKVFNENFCKITYNM